MKKVSKMIDDFNTLGEKYLVPVASMYPTSAISVAGSFDSKYDCDHCSYLEENGVFFTILKWIDERIPEEEDLRAVYDNIHGWRENVFGGSFNPDEDIPPYDAQNRLVLSDFILDGNLVLAEVTDNKYREVVGYIVLV